TPCFGDESFDVGKSLSSRFGRTRPCLLGGRGRFLRIAFRPRAFELGVTPDGGLVVGYILGVFEDEIVGIQLRGFVGHRGHEVRWNVPDRRQGPLLGSLRFGRAPLPPPTHIYPTAPRPTFRPTSSLWLGDRQRASVGY